MIFPKHLLENFKTNYSFSLLFFLSLLSFFSLFSLLLEDKYIPTQTKSLIQVIKNMNLPLTKYLHWITLFTPIFFS